MRRRRIRGLLAGVMLATTAYGLGGETAATVPPARDPELAVAELFERALEAEVNAPLILFLARYPDHRLSDSARSVLKERDVSASIDTAGTDARIIAEFDAARVAGSDALDLFAARHPGHPLSVEALRPIWRE